MTPRKARTEDQACDLERDNVEIGDYAFLISEHNVWLNEQAAYFVTIAGYCGIVLGVFLASLLLAGWIGLFIGVAIKAARWITS